MDLDDLRTKILDDINEAKMPVDMVYYLLQDLNREITAAYNQYLTTKYQQKQKEQELILKEESKEKIEGGQEL